MMLVVGSNLVFEQLNHPLNVVLLTSRCYQHPVIERSDLVKSILFKVYNLLYLNLKATEIRLDLEQEPARIQY